LIQEQLLKQLETQAMARISKQFLQNKWMLLPITTEDYGRLEATKPELAKDIRVIWKSPLIPSDPFVWRKDLDSATKEKIRNFCFELCKE